MVFAIDDVVLPDDYASRYPYSATGRLPGSQASAYPDPLIWMAYVAAATTRLRLMTGVIILPQRNPLVLAKQVATLDRMSGGRIELGIGVGWLKEEFAALGVPFERRGKRADEYVAAMRALWRDDSASFAGEFVNFRRVSCNPKPVAGSVPIFVGGHSEAAARRAGRIGDGFFPSIGAQVDIMPLLDLVRRTAEAAGRDPKAIEIMTGCPNALPNSARIRWRPSRSAAAAASGGSCCRSAHSCRVSRRVSRGSAKQSSAPSPRPSRIPDRLAHAESLISPGSEIGGTEMYATAINSAIFRDTFSTETMRKIFSDEARVQYYLNIEAALARVQARLGIIPAEAADEICRHCSAERFDFALLKSQTERIGYPVLPMVQQLVGLCRDGLGEWCHWGATTQDITDTATVLQIRDALALVEQDLRAIAASLAGLATKYRDTPMAGRSNLQQATPITFGYKCAVLLAGFQRHRSDWRNCGRGSWSASSAGRPARWPRSAPMG